MTKYFSVVFLTVLLVAMVACGGGRPTPPPPPPAAPTVSLTVNPTTITSGDSATLTWSTTNTKTVSIDGIGSVQLSGTKTVSPTATTSYHLTATGDGGTKEATVTVTVNTPPPPPAPTATLSANPATITTGESATLTWSTTNATSVKLDGADVAVNGTQSVTPTATTTYHLVATGAGGSIESDAIVTVNAPAVKKFPGFFRYNNAQVTLASALKKTAVRLSANSVQAQATTPSATMNNSRAHHTATLLDDGTVLIAGGWNGFETLNTAELFDPSTETFTPVANLVVPRYDACATKLADGRVIIVGGANQPTVDVYDPRDQTFMGYNPEGGQTISHCSALVSLGDNRVLIYGGVAAAPTFGPLKPLILDVSLWKMREIAGGDDPLHYREEVAFLKLNDGRILLSGGDSYTTGSAVTTDDLIIFDPTTEQFTQVGHMTSARKSQSLLLLPDGKVGIYGGIIQANPSVIRLKSVEVFDPVLGTTAVVGDLPAVKALNRATLLQNGYVLICGGADENGLVEKTQVIYDHAANEGGYTGDMIENRAYFTQTPLPNGRVLMTGGETGNNGISNTAELFDPAQELYIRARTSTIPSKESLQFTTEGAATITWSAEKGTVDANGLYTAPESLDADTTDQITVTDANDSTKTAKFVLTLIAKPIIIKGTNDLAPNAAGAVFTATVDPFYSNPAVIWSASAGTIDENGNYTAPAEEGNVTITATLVANPNQKTTYAVRIYDPWK